jgi:hypothetical protein
MKYYHGYFYLLKLTILIIVILMSLKIIDVNDDYLLIIDSIFKFSLGLFIIYFFTNHKFTNMDDHDRILIILSGLILILLIKYIKLFNIFKKLFKNDQTK